MKTLLLSLFLCLTAFASNQTAKELHPVIKYPKGHKLQGQQIDTALVGAPVKLSVSQAKEYFPDFNPEQEMALSNIGSGVEFEWFIVRMPLDSEARVDVSEVGFLHEEFSKGMFHGSILFKTNRVFEFVPQNKESKTLKPFKSPYLVASFEGLRKRGLSFGIQNILAGNLIASWNFYTFKGTVAMAIDNPAMKASLTTDREEIDYQDLATTLFYQDSTLSEKQAKEVFHIYLNEAFTKSYTQYYSLTTLTCNNAIENVLIESEQKTKSSSLFSIFGDLVGRRYINNFHLHLVKTGFAKKPRVLLNSLPSFHEYFDTPLNEHREGIKYGR